MHDQRRNFFEQGSALITAVMITSAVGIILIGVSKLTISDVRNTTTLEDGSLAYAAAEAGIEEGLFRWRYNRNVTLPLLANDQTMQGDILRANRMNITSGVAIEDIDLTQPPPAGNEDAIYDLRIWYADRQIGSTSQTDLESLANPWRLYKDQSLDIDVAQLGGENLVIDFGVPGGVGETVQLETRVVTENPDGSITEICPSCKNLTELSERRVIIPLPTTAVGQPVRLRIKPYIVGTPPQGTGVTTPFINYALSLPTLSPTRTDKMIDMGTTFIESTGYFGNAQRKLLAKVDRHTGSILGVYDYALFSDSTVGR